MTADRDPSQPEEDGDDPARVREDLLRVAKMFVDYRDDAIMRELCRLAVKCAQERLIRV